MTWQQKLLIGILIVASFLRFWQLGSNPPSLNWDEVSWGYNAYALGIDGKDEFGKFLPHDYLESYGDYKPPLYAYLTVPSVKIFGLNEFATRFPSALFGVLTVLVTYFLVKMIFSKSEHAESYALFTTFLLAISPWHINLSRAAFEANVATFFLVSGVWLFLKSMLGKPNLLILSAALFALSLYIFNTPRIVAPLLVAVLTIRFYRQLVLHKKQTILACIVGILVILPTLSFLFSQEASLRFKEVNIFTDLSVIERTNQEITNDNDKAWSKILHNRRLAYGVEFIKHYLDNLSPSFLFIKGDGNPKFSTQDVGQLYLWELPFILFGLLMLFRNKEKEWWIIPVWIFLGILPAAAARETPHALRIETTIPMFQLITAYGVIQASLFFKKYRLPFRAILSVLIVVSLLYYLHGYYMHYPHDYSGEWQYGYKDAIAYVKQEENKYDEVYMTEFLGRPYAYMLYYLQYDPRTFREEAQITHDPFGFVHVNGFGKYHFADTLTKFKRDSRERYLFIDKPGNLPKKANLLKTFYLLNGTPVFIAYTLQ